MTWYLLAVSLLTAIITAYDKWAAKHRTTHRIPELTLFLLAIAGGSVAEFLAMLIIRHKTKHKRFMLGLPLIMIVQIVIFRAVFF